MTKDAKIGGAVEIPPRAYGAICAALEADPGLECRIGVTLCKRCGALTYVFDEHDCKLEGGTCVPLGT